MSSRKGIILAGGSGTRLYPMTSVISKQLLPVYDKPLIYYPLATLMRARIQDILVISTPADRILFERLLGNGERFGVTLQYEEQSSPDGISQAFIIGEKFLDRSPCALILGDNIFHGAGIRRFLRDEAFAYEYPATIFCVNVKDPSRFGVALLDQSGKVLSLEEKPEIPKSNLAATGLYFYDDTVSERVKTLKPSSRGELEITDLNNLYLQDGVLRAKVLDPDDNWFDTGTPDSLIEAANYVQATTNMHGKKVACPEEIAYENGWISEDQFLKFINQIKTSSYGMYLNRVIKENGNEGN